MDEQAIQSIRELTEAVKLQAAATEKSNTFMASLLDQGEYLANLLNQISAQLAQRQ